MKYLRLYEEMDEITIENLFRFLNEKAQEFLSYAKEGLSFYDIKELRAISEDSTFFTLERIEKIRNYKNIELLKKIHNISTWIVCDRMLGYQKDSFKKDLMEYYKTFDRFDVKFKIGVHNSKFTGNPDRFYISCYINNDPTDVVFECNIKIEELMKPLIYRSAKQFDL